MLNNVEITTSRLILKAITPAIIHNLFHTKTKEEIMIFFGVDENGYAHFKTCTTKEWKLIVCLCFSFY